MKELLNFVGICAFVAIIWGGISATLQPQNVDTLVSPLGEGVVMMPLSNVSQR